MDVARGRKNPKPYLNLLRYPKGVAAMLPSDSLGRRRAGAGNENDAPLPERVPRPVSGPWPGCPGRGIPSMSRRDQPFLDPAATS